MARMTLRAAGPARSCAFHARVRHCGKITAHEKAGDTENEWENEMMPEPAQ